MIFESAFSKLTYRLDGGKGYIMSRLRNEAGQAVYFNTVEKQGQIRYVVRAISGQTLRGRDRQKRKSRTFAQYHQAEAFLERNGYTITDWQ